MRKYLIPLLLASALAPAGASAQDGGFRGQRGNDERDASSDDRPQRTERPRRAVPAADSEPAVRVERVERPVQVERSVERVEPRAVSRVRDAELDPAVPLVQRRRADGGPAVRVIEPARPVDRGQPVVSRDRDEAGTPGGRVRRPGRDNDAFDDNIRVVRREGGGRQPDEVQVHRDRDGDRDGFSGLRDRTARDGDRTGTRHRWNGDWRRDHRYDWRSYRNRYGSRFRLGRYYDPYGWGYRRFSIGFNMWPSYYRSSFWLNDPWQYRLPPAYGPYRWVRYYDDALLVNVHTGQVVDVINNFFW